VAFDAAMPDLDGVFEPILAAVRRDEHLTATRHARDEIGEIVKIRGVAPGGAITCPVRRNIGAIELRARPAGSPERNRGKNGPAGDACSYLALTPPRVYCTRVVG
jgi:hypothetical protein